MKRLVDQKFENGRIPDSWSVGGESIVYERGCLRSGRVVTFSIPLSGHGWRELRVEVVVQLLDGATLLCANGRVALVSDLKRGRSRAERMPSGEHLRRSRHARVDDGVMHLVVFEFRPSKVSIGLDGVEVFEAADENLGPSFGQITLEFWNNCLVQSIQILADNELKHPLFGYPKRESADFHLEVNVDFVDDLMDAPWTNEMFGALFAEFQSWGVKRCHWIYYGNSQDGWWDNVPWLKDHAIQTVKNVGEIFPAAVAAAHAHGIELYALFKPFEMGLPFSHGLSAKVCRGGKYHRIGGATYWMSDFAAIRRDLVMARKPCAFGDSKNDVFTRIDLVKEDAELAAFSVKDVRLFVSNDNLTYVPYEGPMNCEELIEHYPVWEHTPSGGRPSGTSAMVRVMRFRGLEIREKFIVLEVNGRNASFANTLINIIHVFGENDEERLLTFGFAPRPRSYDVIRGLPNRRTGTFWENGVEFDVLCGDETCLIPGRDVVREHFTLDSGHGILAIARGKDSGPIGLLSPSYPEVREWWLSWLRSCLEAGADGIELRFRHHSYHLTWGEYGFEKPVRDEFLRRYCVDIWETDDFDKSAWRRLRGEGYTEFYRQARKLADSYGRKMGLHISPTLEMNPETGGAIDMHFDWRGWLQEGLADSVTMKEIWPGTLLAEEVLSYTRPRSMEVIFCPFGLDLWARQDGARRCEERILLARDHGYDGFQFYECSAVIRGTNDGQIVMEQPELREIFTSYFNTDGGTKGNK